MTQLPSTKYHLPLIVIVGPTASGKTSLAIEMAEKFGGEIICADSRTVYIGMDIGTAKPTSDDQARVPHWGINLVLPNEQFSAADFKQYADAKITEIRDRGHIPFLVGGTGLYIDSVIFDYQFANKANPQMRTKLEEMAVEELYKYCVQNNIELPKNTKNKRHLVRAVEQDGINNSSNKTPLDNTIIVGITTEKSILQKRISLRITQLLQNGVINEANQLAKKYGWDVQSMSGNIYPLCKEFIEGNTSQDEFLNRCCTQDWQLAKRQITWLKRNPFILWNTLDDARTSLRTLLASEH